MLVKNSLSIEKHCPRRWSLFAGVGLMVLAIVVAGIGFQKVTASAPPPVDKNEDRAKTSPTNLELSDKAAKADEKEPRDPGKKDDPNKRDLPGFPDIEELLKLFPNLPPEQMKLFREQMEMARKMMEEVRKQFPNGGFPGGVFPPAGANFPQFPGIFPRANNPLAARRAEGRLGVRVQKPSAAMVDQLDLPRGQGMILEEIQKDSAADKAGLKAYDILLELNGKPVPDNPREFSRMLEDIKADTPVDAVVLRKSRKETIKGLKLPRAGRGVDPNNLPFPNFPNFPNQPAGQPFPFPNFPNFPNAGFGGTGGITSITRTNDQFTARQQANDVTVTVEGTVQDGKAKVNKIKVQDNARIIDFDSVDKVPEMHRDQVKKLIEMVEKGKVQVQPQFP